ncbi:MAG: ABC transporter permease [Oscillospiraceae bacterium]|jgi:ABC-2 type transport system permease protein|nr:ABC transporter permease [Oscillospiraceae bacterium]
MRAIFRREMSAYFNSPIGYIFLAVFYFFAGIFFFAGPLLGRYSDLGSVFGQLYTVLLFLVPVLTMRLMSEDRRQRTDQLLLTCPLSLSRMVLGKYLAAVLVYFMALMITFVYACVIAIFAPPGWPAFFGNFFATLLLGMAMIGIGMFISSLTENQVVAAVGGFAAALFLLMIDALAGVFTGEIISAVILAVSFYDRYYSFSMGIFDISAVLFFLSVSAIFLFLTVRVCDKRRWGR